MLSGRSGVRGGIGFSGQFVGVGLLLRPKWSVQKHAVPLHIARPRVAGATIAADLFAGLVALDVTAIGTTKADLARLGDLDPLEQTLVRLALGHFGTGRDGGRSVKTLSDRIENHRGDQRDTATLKRGGSVRIRHKFCSPARLDNKTPGVAGQIQVEFMFFEA